MRAGTCCSFSFHGVTCSLFCFLLHTWESAGLNSLFCNEARTKWFNNFIFKVALCALLWLANCPRYNTRFCINLLRVHQLAYCSCNLCPVCTNVGAVVPTSHAHNISPTVWRPLVNMSLAFKSNLFHESSLQVLLLIISDAHSTPCAHLRRAQTPFTHHY